MTHSIEIGLDILRKGQCKHIGINVFVNMIEKQNEKRYFDIVHDRHFELKLYHRLHTDHLCEKKREKKNYHKKRTQTRIYLLFSIYLTDVLSLTLLYLHRQRRQGLIKGIISMFCDVLFTVIVSTVYRLKYQLWNTRLNLTMNEMKIQNSIWFSFYFLYPINENAMHFVAAVELHCVLHYYCVWTIEHTKCLLHFSFFHRNEYSY